MRRTIILSAVAILLTALSIGYFVWLKPAKSETETAQPAKDKPPVANYVAAPGVVEPVSEEIEVGAEIPGKIKHVLVEEGQQVAKGQTIAVLENSDLAANVANAKASIQTLKSQQVTAGAKLLQAQKDRERIFNGSRIEERRDALSEVEKTLPNVENARREYERRKNLYDLGDISREEMERARTGLENAEKQTASMRAKYNVVNAAARPDDLARADAAIRLAQTQVDEFDAMIREAETRVRTAEANLDKTIVKAPIAGAILRKRLKDGESVSPENLTGIVSMADVSALRVRVDLDETDVARVRAGRPAYVTADAYGSQRFAAKVIRIGEILGRKNFRTERPTEKVDTKILEVLLELEPDQKIPLGLRVDAYILTD